MVVLSNLFGFWRLWFFVCCTIYISWFDTGWQRGGSLGLLAGVPFALAGLALCDEGAGDFGPLLVYIVCHSVNLLWKQVWIGPPPDRNERHDRQSLLCSEGWWLWIGAAKHIHYWTFCLRKPVWIGFLPSRNELHDCQSLLCSKVSMMVV